ncbi:hypothetical protein YUBABA_00670 [Serratia phage vB_SmaM-Yubaba]|nr:hypothetical protein YUBABA_00670 [Serratia phage vB_SmaM-Yubaba]
MLKKLVVGETYLNESGIPFKVFGIGLYGKNYRTEMVLHQNLETTDVLPEMFTPCVLTKKQFMKTFKEVPVND